ATTGSMRRPAYCYCARLPSAWVRRSLRAGTLCYRARVSPRRPCVPLLVFLALGAGSVSHADEGMWPFNHLPLPQLERRYGFVPGADWLEHVRRAVVSVSTCSGSFVSSQGLTLTNQHCAQDCLSRVSDAQHDYTQRGFYAGTSA